MQRHFSPIYRIASLALFSSLLISAASAQQRPELTMEWAYGKAGMTVAAVPRVLWLKDGSAIFYNQRLPEAERTFARFDPASGQQRPMVDSAKALASLKSLLPNNKAMGLTWPDEFDATGSKAAYLFEKDVFLLDLPAQPLRA